MITLEEIAKRLDEKKLEKADIEGIADTSKKEEKWSIKKIDEYERPHALVLPPFEEIPGAQTRRDIYLSKILAFVNIIKRIRFDSGCTIIPISTWSRPWKNLWGNPDGVSSAIDFMIKMGLMSIENSKYRFNNAKGNLSRTYRYYRETEAEFIAYCEEHHIEEFKKSATEMKMPKKDIDVDIKDVKISSDLALKKPDGCSKKEFENYLEFCLCLNYRELYLHYQIADNINGYYKDYPELRIRFKPKFTWDKTGKIVKKIGIRANNLLCNSPKEDRENIKARYGFTTEYDVGSSVARITASLNRGSWLDDDKDLYKEIYKKMYGTDDCSDEEREAIKKLYMRVYFDKSEALMDAHIWHFMNKKGIKQQEVFDELKKLREAVIEVAGGKLYGSALFLIESCVYMDTLYDLLSAGQFTWVVYDCFYSSEGKDIDFGELVKYGLKNNFMLYYKDFCEKESKSEISGSNVEDIINKYYL